MMIPTELKLAIMDNTRQIDLIRSKMDELTRPLEYYSLRDAAGYLRLSESTLKRYKSEIGFSQRDKAIIFRRYDLDQWFNRNYSKS